MNNNKEYFPKIVRDSTDLDYKTYEDGLVLDPTKGEYIDNPSVDLKEYMSSASLTEVIQCDVLELCLCGDAGSNLKYILETLNLLSRKSEFVSGLPYFSLDIKGRIELEDGLNVLKSEFKEHFKCSEAENFMYYWLDNNGYTEHGSSIPGWLTPKGKELLKLLTQWWEQEGKERENND